MTTALQEAPPVTERIARADAAERLGVSIATVDRYLAEGLLTRHKNPVTKRVQLDAAEVEQLRRTREGQ